MYTFLLENGAFALCKISMVSCQKGRFWQDTIDICDAISCQENAQLTNSDIYLKRMSIYTIWEISPNKHKDSDGDRMVERSVPFICPIAPVYTPLCSKGRFPA